MTAIIDTTSSARFISTTARTVKWTTDTLPSGVTFTRAVLGEITVNGTTAEVLAIYDPEWFDRRPGNPVEHPGVASAPGLLRVFYNVDVLDIDPAVFMAAAPAALTCYRPDLAR